MKTLFQSQFNQALFFLSIATICTFFASCDKKDSCQECAEEKAEQQALMQADSTSEADTNTAEYQKQSNAVASKPANSGKTKTTVQKETVEEDNSNVSIINPNDKSNSDSKRTYGSSGTGGGSGTSGSGGDGNGSSGWNADAKKDKK